MPNHTPTVNELKRALSIAEQIEQLENELSQIMNGSTPMAVLESKPAPQKLSVSRRGGKRIVSPEARARMAAGQKARWSKARGEDGGATPAAAAPAKGARGTRKKRVLSPEGRARIVAALKARHAANKAAASKG